MSTILFLALASALAQTAATAPPTPVIPSADLQTDLAALREAYEELHPGLYRYSGKTEMDRKFQALSKQFSQDLSLKDAYLAISIFAAQVKCGHTYPNFFNQKKEIANMLFRGHNRVPFYFRWLKGEMVVTRDFTRDQSLPRGTRVLSINGTPVHAILAWLMTIARADGSNDAKRVSYLEVTGDSAYEAFDIYFPLFFPPNGARLQITVQRLGDTRPKTQSLEALTFEERVAPIRTREKSRSTGGDEILFDWKVLPDGSAYLRMPTWALYNTKWDWMTWLNSRLDELASKPGSDLIVDLRGNEGGNDVGDEILKRFVRSDLKTASYRRLVRYRKTPADLNSYLDTWDPSFRDWSTDAVELAKAWRTAPPVSYFSLDRSDRDSVIRPSAKPIRGRLYVLIDASNSSATFQFAQTVQQEKLGTLVGQPTGGNRRGINGGAFFFLRLPKSQIEVDLPIIGYFPSVPQPDSGLSPDLLVSPTLQDIADGRDTEMAALEGLRRKTKYTF